MTRREMTDSQLPFQEGSSGGEGGLTGVRMWAAAASGRAESLLLPDPAGPPRPVVGDPAVRDRAIDELAQLERLLGAGEKQRAVLAARLGGLLALRLLNRQGEAADRERAVGLLREARSAVPGLSGWEAKRAALMLVLLLLPLPEVPTSDPPAFSDLLAFQQANAAALRPDNPVVSEVRVLLDELAEVPWPPELARQLDDMRTVFALMGGSTDEFFAGVGSLVDALPPDFPFLPQLRALRDLMPEEAAPPPGRAEPQPTTAPDPTAAQEADERDQALLLALVNLSVPGSLSPAQVEELADLVHGARVHGADDPEAAAGDAITYAALQLIEALRDNDLERLAAAVEQVRRSGEQLPQDSAWYPFVSTVEPLMLALTAELGGNLQDREAAEQRIAAANERFAAGSTPAEPGAVADVSRVFAVRLRVDHLVQEEDAAGLEQCVAELLALREAGLGGDAVPISELVLGDAYQQLGRLRGDSELLELGLAHVTAASEALVPVADSLGVHESWLTAITAIRADLTQDTELLRARLDGSPAGATAAGTEPTAAARMRSMALALQAEMSGDRADLDRAIAELAAVQTVLRGGGTRFKDADLLWTLADLHRRRGDAALDDPANAARAMVESFEATAADVLLQSGAEHRLLTARDGASRAVQAAWWAGSHGQVEQAVTMLELGRSMVLQATAAAADVPELLTARGHRELAEAWRAAGGGADPGSVPSLLRRRALDALGYRAGSGPFEPATVAELNAGLLPSDADALVYLLAGAGSAPGMAIVLGPDLEPGVLALPLLAGDRRAPLEKYLDVSAERSRLLAAGQRTAESAERLAAVEERWEQALSALADWALPAAVGPVLQGIAERLAANPGRRRGRPGGPRLVLVPCGTLGVVPWHAARLPEGAPYRYICEVAVLSYAASGREFLRAAGRERLAPDGRSVLVADPRLDLTGAEDEVLALRDGCYPNAELYGDYYELDEPPVRAGTPEEVLALLPGAEPDRPVSLLHIASHGSAGLRPTVSALNLAVPPDSPAVPPGTPDAGMLTVSRLLDRRDGASASAGPLVVLSACETDLSTRDHDQALTLATAFLAAGATDVLASRWTARDSASALMMAVFHHFRAKHGSSPADALQAAQRWMLDPDRTAPPGLSPHLRREVGRPHLARLPVWAAFVHHGSPGAVSAVDVRTAGAPTVPAPSRPEPVPEEEA
ncbi:CHAT domain-containing protein [Kitasatospora griseola]|uniref:CHAT domain-containing protein n=1 Tax=Kitasatospora griseola TaxID=2064 RepID=UPI0038560702